MNFSKNFQKSFSAGFTLIELLVVVAIIGILASVVLASLNSARNKGKDAAIKASLSSLRSAGEIDYDSNGNYSTVCTEAAAGVGNSTLTLTAGTEYAKINTAIDAQKGGANNTRCNEGATSATYAAWVTLLATPNQYFCIDSTGTAKLTVAADPAADAIVCP